MIKELVLTENIQGEGDNLYVLVKSDSDNYCGLWYANDINHLKEQYITTDDEDDSYWNEHLPILIGKLIEFKN